MPDFTLIEIDQLGAVTGGGMEMQTEAGPGQSIPPHPVQNENGILRPRSQENTASGLKPGAVPLFGPDFDGGRHTRQIGV